MPDLLTISTIQEFNQAITQQRSTTRKVLSELNSIGEDLLAQNVGATDEALAKLVKTSEAALLEKYARLPTLTEFRECPAFFDLESEGGTFGVAAVVGDVLLNGIRSIEPKFERLHRHIMLLLLRELNEPSTEEVDMADPILRFLRLELSESLQSLTEEKRRKLVHGMMRPLITAMLAVMLEYGIVTSPDEHGYLLTPVGRRVFFHLIDIQRFIDTVSAAHRMLKQSGVPA